MLPDVVSHKSSISVAPSPRISISIVSHGQGTLVRHLLADLAKNEKSFHEIILTLNIPEDESFLDNFPKLPIKIIRNTYRKGFGENHNAAFQAAEGEFFAVANPDIRIPNLDLKPLLSTLGQSGVGACGPMVLSSTGRIEDNARHFPTFTRLARRVLTGERLPDYVWQQEPIKVDWLAGMFVLFSRQAFAAVGGFDERYFMYFEDADICRRLYKHGWSVRLNPQLSVIHDAQRDSHRSMQHLRWHLRSALRFLLC